MNISLPPCHDSTVPGQNLCPMSCGRRMFRGSGELLEFGIDDRPGEYHGKMEISGAFVCHKYAGADDHHGHVTPIKTEDGHLSRAGGARKAAESQRSATFHPPVLIGYSGDGVPGWDDSCASYFALNDDMFFGMVQSGGANRPGHKVPMLQPAPLVFSDTAGRSWTSHVGGTDTKDWANCDAGAYCLPWHGAFDLTPSQTKGTLHTWGSLTPRYEPADRGAVSFVSAQSTEFSVDREGGAARLTARDGPPVRVIGLPVGMTGNAKNDCRDPERVGGESTANDTLAFIFGAVQLGPNGFIASAEVCEAGARGNSIAVFESEDSYTWRFVSVAVSAGIWQARDLVRSYGDMYNRSGVGEHDLTLLKTDNSTLVLTFRPGGDSGCLANPNPGGRYWPYCKIVTLSRFACCPSR